MNSLIEKTSKVHEAFDLLPKLSKSIGLLGTIFGLCYLWAYMREIGIPFPLELSVLPTMLPLVGVTSIGGVAVLVGGILIPALLADDPLNVTKPYLLARDTCSNIAAARLTRYLLCCWVPMTAALVALFLQFGLFGKGAWVTPTTVGLLGLSLLWILLTPTRVEAFKGKWLEYTISVLIQTLLSVGAYCLMTLLIVAAYPDMETWPAWQVCALVLIMFTGIHFVITVPHDKRLGGKILMPPYYQYEAAPGAATAFFIASFFIVLTVVIYPLNAKIGRTVLHAFGVGGGIPAIVCLKNKAPERVVQRVGFGQDDCSVPLKILFDGGDRIYVAPAEYGQKTNGTNAPAVIEPVFFRQDEIREKIYLSTSVKK